MADIGNEAFVMGDFFTRIYRSVDEVFENWSFPKGSKKKYRPERRISSLDELKSQNVVVVYGKTYDMGWVRGWQFGRVYTLASKGAIRLAEARRCSFNRAHRPLNSRSGACFCIE